MRQVDRLAQKSKILYVQTSGTDTPERLYAPFILGATAAAMGLEATVYFVIKAITEVKRGEAEKIKLGAFPSLREVMDQAVDAGVRLMVCEQSCQLLGLDRGDFVEDAAVVGAATLNDLLLESDAMLSF
ncbi:MAG: DsrE family protein [Candidatus Bathyarchaeota archaeon]|nr:MAG: DsrE family protein [Candidatus Bathyarchaeota archaeon]